MITFWIVVTVMTIVALLFAVPPLLGRGRADAAQRRELNIAIYHERLAELTTALDAGDLDQATFDSTKGELEHELLYDVAEQDSPASESSEGGSGKITATAVALLIPLLSLALYLQLGAHKIIPFLNDAASQQQASGSHSAEQFSVAEMVTRLEQRMEATPDDLRGWVMLARSYMELKRYNDAVRAYARAVELEGEIAPLLVDYAEALGVANDGDLRGQPTTLLERAVTIEPEHQKGLWLAGVAAYQFGSFDRAVVHWRTLLAHAEKRSDMVPMVSEYLAKAEAELTPEQRSRLAATAPPAAEPEPAAGAEIAVTVTLDPALAAKAEATDTLFIFARATSGPRMPLAIVRKQVGDLPLTVTLSDAQAMMSNMRLSNFEQVIVGARISKSGNAMAQSGDIEGHSAPLSPTATDAVAITIDQLRP